MNKLKLHVIVSAFMFALILTACLPQSETGKQPATQPALPQEAQQAEEPSMESIEQDINAQELDEIDNEVGQLTIE